MSNDIESSMVSVKANRTPPRGYKWIAREIESLDPDRDYARIIELMTAYRTDDVAFNMGYTLGFSNLTQDPYASELMVEPTAKITKRKTARAHDTMAHFWIWNEQGPESLTAQRSIERVNRIHAALSKQVPEAFVKEVFVYTGCLSGTFPNYIRRLIGLKEFTENEKVATHRFWKAIVMKMRDNNGDYVDEFPKDFAEMEKFVEMYDSHPWQSNEYGRILSQALVAQFVEDCFPKPLHGFGRQLILALQKPHIRKLQKMGDPHPVAAWKDIP